MKFNTINYNLLDFYYKLDLIFKISTIVEKSGHTTDLAKLWWTFANWRYLPGGSLQLHMSIHFAPQKCGLAF